MNKKNPYSICTWDTEDGCKDCKIEGKLICKADKPFREKFILKHLTFRGTAFLGLFFIGAFSNNWWLTIAYAIGVVLNFGILEPRLLCSHCPFYAEKGFILHCNTLYGLPKLWKYRPGPMSKTEKVLQAISGGFVDLFPILAFIYGDVLIFINPATSAERIAMVGMTAVISALMIQVGGAIRSEVCTKCPNFSCGLNEVPKSLRDAYIKRNPVMKDAWEKAGYKFDK
ncbi:MAG: hypothetical protein FH761_05335 [Firmicutes bacterium]|nr:hypothetical protein [Bacillota bacterium]